MSDLECVFELNAAGLWECRDCGHVHKRATPRPPRRRTCRPKRRDMALEEGERLGWTAKDAACWSLALARWVKAGRPVRSDAEVAARVAVCQSHADDCYAAVQSRCRVCGCCLSEHGMVVVNKAKMGTEDCPRGLWPKLF